MYVLGHLGGEDIVLGVEASSPPLPPVDKTLVFYLLNNL